MRGVGTETGRRSGRFTTPFVLSSQAHSESYTPFSFLSLNKYLLTTYCVPDTALDRHWGTAVRNTILCYLLVGEQVINTQKR